MVYRKLESGGPIALAVRVPNREGQLDIRDFIKSVADVERDSGIKFNIPENVSQRAPDLTKWPTRIVTKELLGRLPKDIDDQCPKVGA
jgi:hypothetical protein